VIRGSLLGEVLGCQRMFFNSQVAVETYQTQFEEMLQPAPNAT
jgi:hypothetical protein